MSVIPQDLRSPTAPLPRSGDILAGKYKVEQVLGEGGMCVVFAALHLQLHERVAIKVLRPDFAKRPDAVERFMREGRAAIRIRSEYVVRILDVDMLDNGDPFIVMEHLDGSDLEALILANGPSPIVPAVDHVLQAGEAIAEAHTLGIVHRDLKPANLFLTRRADGSPWIKVLDFGISKTVPRASGRHHVRLTGDEILGSPQYMSPEQLRSTRDVDPRTDIWSLGAILHELLTGAPPFEGDTVTAVIARILQDRAPFLTETRPDVPSGLESVVRRCLERDASRRFANVAELAVALSEYASPAGRASALRIVGILQTAGEGTPRGVLVHAREQTAWGSTDPLTLTATQRRGIGSKLGVLALAGALAGAGGLVYTRPAQVAHTLVTIAAAIPRPPPMAEDPPPALTREPIDALRVPASRASRAPAAIVTAADAGVSAVVPAIAAAPPPSIVRAVVPPAPPSRVYPLPPPPPETVAPTATEEPPPVAPEHLFDERK